MKTKENVLTPLVSMKDMLITAKREQYAVGQFNINHLESIQAFLTAGEEEESPLILGASDRLIDYLGGFQTIVSMVESLVKAMSISVPVTLHLDHGKSVERCKAAVDAGFTSVMIDGSQYSIDENIKMTKEVVDYAHSKGVSVEAEVGSVGGTEDGVVGGVKYADPDECLKLVEETKVDALAAALGSVHGPYQGEPKLGFVEMKQISEMTQVPLVLHGGSGIPIYQLQKAIQLGHAKINVNTECIQAWTNAVREVLNADAHVYEPRIIHTPAKEAMKEMAKSKMKEFMSSKKA
ncbi:class II fructose-1,6-bisphosphate aldolase [Halobacillus karajensis]|uniref:6-phospho-5-dehydro-2-deoxy-D-gluconate aldolase n=1 Tax=Halobacillus karajensis TaxID=195088 RepID=A0A024P4R9_9BACI|nr:class II fructose-1,6-bisphosphate aldolase [Halobacillus karajensis]CDQ20777.1 6-phospho-5-dehydro-2-deoxy-D-gluconate aldolase [Halobacillus karajensis]CDQ23753.1 6-phospho-5-dehydro-2-deoxy-D-gluconate aldolase [Halobacillus karajensis]CDQ27231.1 6-phospho-5-dehydro-2-deoxy-D-gluconate aldolase [Halobacillus karajensis]